MTMPIPHAPTEETDITGHNSPPLFFILWKTPVSSRVKRFQRPVKGIKGALIEKHELHAFDTAI